MEEIKVFISQPMKDRSNEIIECERNTIFSFVDKVCSVDNGKAILLKSFFKDAPHDAQPLWYLGKSLELLSQADVAIFAPGWEEARGCRIEHQCAEEYGIEILEL